jgi:hypothetical protein
MRDFSKTAWLIAAGRDAGRAMVAEARAVAGRPLTSVPAQPVRTPDASPAETG